MSIINFFKLGIEGQRAFRNSSLTNEFVSGLIVDTCFTSDTNKWETGIKKDGKWIIVEMYNSKDEAKKGHEKWCNNIKENTNLEIKSCISPIQWALGDY